MWIKVLPGILHRYLGANAGSWEIYGSVLARQYNQFGYPDPTHRLTVDTWAVQHPGKPARRAIQSVAVHLISLYLVPEHGLSGAQAKRAVAQLLAQADRFAWLDPPNPNGNLTISHVFAAGDFAEHCRLVEGWAWDIWNAWSAQHNQVNDWAINAKLLPGSR